MEWHMRHALPGMDQSSSDDSSFDGDVVEEPIVLAVRFEQIDGKDTNTENQDHPESSSKHPNHPISLEQT